MSHPLDHSFFRTVATVLSLTLVSGVPGIAAVDSAGQQPIDWRSAEDVRWDAESRVFVVADSAERERIDWGAGDQIQWDPETRQLVVTPRDETESPSGEAGEVAEPIEPRQPIRWDSLEQIQWDPETRSFITTERTAPTPASETPSEFDERNYRLSVRDQVEFEVFDEDLSQTQRIDGSGQIRIPLLGNQAIAGMSVREAEDFIERLYVENRILRNPVVTIRVAEYAPKEVSIFGAVARQGTQEFPIERNRMDIVEVVSRAGGFRDIARQDDVKVTRILENGDERTFSVDVEAMITGRRQSPERFHVLPGDVIYVRERIF